MGYTRGICNVGNGGVEYLDTGAPSNKSYKTFLLIPGAAHTAYCYIKMLDKSPQNVRAIAITQRGLRGSSPLTPSQLSMSPRDLYDILIADIHTFLSFVQNELNVPDGVTILAWSLSTAVVMGLFTPEHLSKTKSSIPFLERIIFWDPPANAVHGQPVTATGRVYFRLEMFIDYVASFFNYPSEYLTSREPNKATQVFSFAGSTLEDPEYPAWAEKAVDMSTREANLLPQITNDPALTEETAREAHRLLGGTEGLVKEVLYGTKAVPENLEGCWVSRNCIEEGGGTCKVTVIEGVNHFAHFHEPEKMWDALLS